jgi:hypothetical protein
MRNDDAQYPSRSTTTRHFLLSSVQAIYHDGDKDDDNNNADNENDDDDADCVIDEDGETCLPPTTTYPNSVASESMESADEHLYKKGPSPFVSKKKDEL